uniref:Uncharacterized protein n=1 Tax=Anopheles epiroticus TaxID=199890 RepID=A0A182P5D5_9DIPT
MALQVENAAQWQSEHVSEQVNQLGAMKSQLPCEYKRYKLDFSGLAGRAAAGGSRDDDGASGLQGDSKGSTTSTEASM